ncbi:arylesterase [Zobellella denitrificans]|jgi:acyl-CoA thioesterase-1|uniref:Acyl-CoA thioesterase n=1 Tax=Zobellella denitrificans TaxID=347534 RepID=A0A231MU94_9GAMM|nr:arylesterase [Zobellella denitrificans]ATG73091.1 acyl-CoA thioesterase [Zobellella denitrificans]OXS13782.1 arylesterase [Zobellella denitrificans]
MPRILLTILLLVSSVAHANTVLILGDSLSAGYRMNADQAWPRLLAEQWRREGRNVEVVNASVSGDTTQGGLQRLPPLLERHQPSLVVLELGGNDGLRGLPPPLIERNLDTMIALADRAGARVVLTEIRLPPNYGRRYLEQFEGIFDKLAKRHELPLLPFFVAPLLNEHGMMMDDGIHPTAEAQPLIARQVHAFLTPYLEP